MAKLIFTEEDERLIESLLGEFNPEERMAHLEVRDLVPAAIWDALISYQRGVMRLYFEAALISNALLERAVDDEDAYQRRAFTIDLTERLGTSDEEFGYPHRWSTGVPNTAVSEYEDLSANLIHEPLARILGIDFEPISS